MKLTDLFRIRIVPNKCHTSLTTQHAKLSAICRIIEFASSWLFSSVDYLMD